MPPKQLPPEELYKLYVTVVSNDLMNYMELATFVDKPDFLQLLPSLRKEFNVTKLLTNQEFIEITSNLVNSKQTGKVDWSKFKNPQRLLEFAKEYPAPFSEVDEALDMVELLETEAMLICLELNRPASFAEVVKQAIYCGFVDEDYFVPTSIDVIGEFPTTTMSTFHIPQVAITVSPTTRYEDVKSALRQAKEMYENDPRVNYYRPKVDMVNNIEKYRMFYWLKFTGGSYQKIADAWTDQHPEQTTTYLEVIRGVKKYRQLLSL